MKKIKVIDFFIEIIGSNDIQYIKTKVNNIYPCLSFYVAVNQVNEISVKNRRAVDVLIQEVSRFKVE
jgi:hypothetical protein